MGSKRATAQELLQNPKVPQAVKDAILKQQRVDPRTQDAFDNPRMVSCPTVASLRRTTDATNLYNAFCKLKKPWEADGINFRNEGEKDCYLELKARQVAGEIRNLQYESMKFKLIGHKIRGGKARWYTPDFTFEEIQIDMGVTNSTLSACEKWRNVAVDYKGGSPYALKKWNEVAELFRVKFPNWELREMK